MKKKNIGVVIELSISFQGDVSLVRLAIFIDFTTLQGAPLVISFKFLSSLWQIFARFAIFTTGLSLAF